MVNAIIYVRSLNACIFEGELTKGFHVSSSFWRGMKYKCQIQEMGPSMPMMAPGQHTLKLKTYGSIETVLWAEKVVFGR